MKTSSDPSRHKKQFEFGSGHGNHRQHEKDH